MKIRHAIITLLSGLALCPVLAGVILFFREERTLREFANTYIYVAMGLGLLGGLAATGARSGGGVEREVTAASMNARDYREADARDAGLGIGFGWTVLLAGAISFGLGVLLFKLT